jgi:hypothetical protein
MPAWVLSASNPNRGLSLAWFHLPMERSFMLRGVSAAGNRGLPGCSSASPDQACVVVLVGQWGCGLARGGSSPPPPFVKSSVTSDGACRRVGSCWGANNENNRSRGDSAGQHQRPASQSRSACSHTHTQGLLLLDICLGRGFRFLWRYRRFNGRYRWCKCSYQPQWQNDCIGNKKARR